MPTGQILRLEREALDIDPFSPDANAASIATDAAVRDTAPLVWLSHYRMWASARHETVRTILGDWENFSSAKRPFDHADFPLPALLVTDDPPSHGPARKLANRLLSPVVVKRIAGAFEAVAQALVEDVRARGTIDAVSDLSQPYVLRAFGDAMGLVPEGRDNLLPFGAAVLNTFGPANPLFFDLAAGAENSGPWVDAQCKGSALAPGSIGAELFALADQGECSTEFASMLMRIFLSAGVDTSIAIIVNMLHGLAQHPDQWQLLKQRPELAAGAFEETHRWNSPSRMFGRVAQRDVEVAGTVVSAGQGILLFVSGTGRDSRVWPDPDRFDITRRPGRHLSFGFGIHNCVGQMFARAEVMALLKALIEQVETIESIAAASPLASNTIQSFAKLPVELK